MLWKPQISTDLHSSLPWQTFLHYKLYYKGIIESLKLFNKKKKYISYFIHTKP